MVRFEAEPIFDMTLPSNKSVAHLKIGEKWPKKCSTGAWKTTEMFELKIKFIWVFKIWNGIKSKLNLQIEAVAHVGVHGDDSESGLQKESVVTIFAQSFRS